jgi:hypothetical protein
VLGCTDLPDGASMKPHHLPEKCPTCSAPIHELTGEGFQEVALYACVAFTSHFGPSFIGSHMEVGDASGEPFFVSRCPHSDEVKAEKERRKERERQIDEAVAAALVGVGATEMDCQSFSIRNGARGIWQLLPKRQEKP